jgi:glutamine amidotransferase
MKVVILDYGMGNIRSIIGALKYIGLDNIVVSNSIHNIKSADKLVLPGVGSFSAAMQSIKEMNIDECLKNEVLIKKKPILGICLGMQLMANSSEEGGLNKGLGIVDSYIQKFNDVGIKIPHVGFNQVNFNKGSRLFAEIDNFSDFYFSHSFKMSENRKMIQSVCKYGEEFVSSYENENIAGVQFHPELSKQNGLRLLSNFINLF